MNLDTIKSGTVKHLLLRALDQSALGLTLNEVFSQVRNTLHSTKYMQFQDAHLAPMVKQEAIVCHDERYYTTQVGRKLLAKLDARKSGPLVERSTISKMEGFYRGTELRPYTGRPGAMDAFKIASKINQKP